MKLHVYNACVNFRLVSVLDLCTVCLAVRPSAYKSVTSLIYLKNSFEVVIICNPSHFAK